MAENNLDDFFSQKDKRKKKTKAQKFTVDDILQTKQDYEQKIKTGKSSKKGTKDSANSDGVVGPKLEGDDEWVEVEAETEKDYSGLRIQNIQITGKGDDDRQDGSSQRVDGDEGEGKDSAQGPWKPLPGSTPAAAVGTPAVASVQKKPEPCAAESAADTPKQSTGKYVPPQMRRTQGDTPVVTVTSASSSRLGKKTAPNVNSQEDFPTLGSAVEPSEGFEKIRSGARQIDDPASQHAKLSLGNKFDALDADDS